jgi:hypothetical protein
LNGIKNIRESIQNAFNLLNKQKDQQPLSPSFAMKKVDLLHVSCQRMTKMITLLDTFLPFQKRLVAVQNQDAEEYHRLTLQIQEIDIKSAQEEKERCKWKTIEAMLEAKKRDRDYKKAVESAKELKRERMLNASVKNKYNPWGRVRTMPVLPFKSLKPLDHDVVYEEPALPPPISKQPAETINANKQNKKVQEEEKIKRQSTVFDSYELNDFEIDIDLSLLGSNIPPPPVAVRTIPESVFVPPAWKKTMQKIKEYNDKNGIPTLFQT